MLTPDHFRLLRLLATVERSSVDELAARLAISAVEVRRLASGIHTWGTPLIGLERDSPGLAEPFAFLDQERLRAELDRRGLPYRVEIVDSIASTNTALAARAGQESIDGAVLATELQTAGRGRNGRQWVAAPGGSLTFSVGVDLGVPAARYAGLSLSIGVAVARGLLEAGIGPIALKWPNDLLWRFLKLGGILIDVVSSGRRAQAVIGIGVNVRLPAAARTAIDQPVTDLVRVAGAPVDRVQVLACLLGALARMRAEFSDGGFRVHRDEWVALHAHQGRRVVARDAAGAARYGVVTGVDDDGALRLDSAGASIRLVAGEVSLREAVELH